jgi:hypothetical protein
MAFAPDRRFGSIAGAFDFILHHHVVRPGPDQYGFVTAAGLAVPKKRPAYLFRAGISTTSIDGATGWPVAPEAMYGEEAKARQVARLKRGAQAPVKANMPERDRPARNLTPNRSKSRKLRGFR